MKGSPFRVKREPSVSEYDTAITSMSLNKEGSLFIWNKEPALTYLRVVLIAGGVSVGQRVNKSNRSGHSVTTDIPDI
jgi:hypothetical protein